MKNDDSKFRVFPADEINSNKFGYWNIESIGGYHAVKLRHYQDLMDVGGFRRPVILNMLNVKYIITNKKIENKAFKKIEGNNLYENLDVLPRSWARLTSRASFFLATFFCLFLFFNERKSILKLKKS